MENFETQEVIITECFKCGRRFENYFKASPCCTSLVVKVDENGNRTSITFLSSLSKPEPEFLNEDAGEDAEENPEPKEELQNETETEIL